MNEKTKYQAAIPWLIALCIAIIVMMAISYFSVDWMVVDPVTHGRGISMLHAIGEFSDGNPATDPMWTQRIAALSGIILFFVVGPVLWLLDSKSSGTSKGSSWYAGVSLIMIGFVIAVLGTWHMLFNTGQEREIINRNENTDQVRSELAMLNTKAMELYWLPKEKGGTGHDVRLLSLSNLKEDDSFENTYKLEKSTSDSTFTIYGIGQQEGRSPEFQNANGATGKVQLVTKVDPQELETEWLRTDSLRN